LVVAFQPHRYSRTKELFDDFVKCFYDADVLILTDIYAASEQPIEGVSAEALVAAIKKHGQRDVSYVADRETLPEYLAGIFKAGDIVLTLGAGNIWQAGEALLKTMRG
jgi:UDP-N-acetylmuramate--alanine ligase